MLDSEIVKWIGMAIASMIAIGAAWKALKMLLIDVASAPINNQIGEFKQELNQGLASIRSIVGIQEEKLRHEFDEKNHRTMELISGRIDAVVKDYNDLDKLYIRKFAEIETDLHHTKNYQREIMDRIDRFEAEIKALISDQGRKFDEYMKISRGGVSA
jgi:hypothetical protein